MEAIHENDVNKSHLSVFSSHFESTEKIVSSPKDNNANSSTTTIGGNLKWTSSSSSSDFGRVLRREMSSCRKPTMNNRLTADQNRSTDYVVEISCIFIRLGEIDTLRETFFAEAFLQAKWIDKNLSVGDTYDPDRHWNPDIIIENAIKGLSIKKTYSIKERENRKKGAIVCEKWILRGIFWQSLRLKNFPIDVQELTISLASLKPISELKFKQSHAKISAVIQEGFIDQQEWKLYSFVVCKEVIVSHKLSADEYPSYLITAFTCRRPNYYYYNAFFLIFLITLSSMTTFSMGCDLPQSRLQTTCTVLLTSITFKWVINRSLPTVYYLTSLDFYSLMNIILICTKCCWHALIGYLNNTSPNKMRDGNDGEKPNNRLQHEDRSDGTHCKEGYHVSDNIAFFFFLIVFLLMNLIFTYWYLFKAKRESKLLDEKERRFLNELKKDDEMIKTEKTLTRKYHYKSMYVNENKRKSIENSEVDLRNKQKNGDLTVAAAAAASSNIHLEHITVKPHKRTVADVKRAKSHLSFSIPPSTSSTYNRQYSQTPILTSLEEPSPAMIIESSPSPSPITRHHHHHHHHQSQLDVFSIQDSINNINKEEEEEDKTF